MNWFELTLTILGIFSTLGIFFGGLGFAYSQFRQGRNKADLDTINIFKERIDALELKIDDQEDEIGRLTDEVKKLQQLVVEKDDKLLEAVHILQGRDPKTQEFFDLLTNYAQVNTPLLETIRAKVIPTVERLDKFLDKQVF